MKMRRLARMIGPAFAAGLLGACSTAPWMPDKAWTVEPVMTVQHGSQNAAGYYALGRLEEHKPATKALEAYRKAVDADPAFVPAWTALGTLHARLGQLEDALQALERAVDLSPASSHLHNNLGYALLLAGRDEAAATTLRRAVQLDGTNRRAWRNLADAYRRLGDPGNAELAEARANGTWPSEALASVAAKPMPIRTATAVESRDPPKLTPSSTPPVADSPAAVAVAQANTQTRLVKIAENVYQLRATPEAVTAPAPQQAAASPAAVAVFPVTPATPLTPLTPMRTAEPTGAAPSSARYEISNGHGRTGLARRVATLLRESGMPMARLTNQRPFTESASVVQYRQGFRDAAEALAARLPFRPAVAAAPSAGLVADVRLLLGHDLNVSAACFELELCARPVLAAAQPGERATD